jgi:hypothetical protein
MAVYRIERAKRELTKKMKMRPGRWWQAKVGEHQPCGGLVLKTKKHVKDEKKQYTKQDYVLRVKLPDDKQLDCNPVLNKQHLYCKTRRISKHVRRPRRKG